MRDLREYDRQTNKRLIWGGILILFLIGDGLIYLFYGPSAAITGFLCLLGGVSPLALIGIFLKLIEWIAKKTR